ncbi:MAG: DoxX family protein [Acidimicrobiales bacterium]
MGALAWIAGILLILLLLMAGTMKITEHEMSLDVARRLGVPDQMWTYIGGAEVLGAIGLFLGLLGGDLEFIGLIAAVGVIALMAGALIYHQRAGDPPKEMLGPLVGLLLTILYVVAIGAR